MGIENKGLMKGCICLFFSLVAIQFNVKPVYAQDSIPALQVTLPSRSWTINQVLDEITLQTGYRFTYNSALIDGKRRVFFSVDSLSLNTTLDSLLDDPMLGIRVIDRNIVIYQKNESSPFRVNQEINRVLVSGKVLDSRSGKPLPYATLALSGTSLGSISNEEGEFSFKIPGNLPDPILAASYMGYTRAFLPIHYPADEVLIITLDREMIPLQEVIIRFADPRLLLGEALNRVQSNYLDDHSTMTAFYRESVKRNDHYMIYSEALLDVAKTPYTQNLVDDRVRIRKGRKITDVTSEDTVVIKLRSGVYTSLSLDVIRDRPDFLSYDFRERYDLEFNDLTTYGDRLVYVISFRPKSNIQELLFRGDLYLDQESLAIIAADFEYDPVKIHKEPGLFLVSRSQGIRIRPIMARYHVDYRSTGGKFHVSQVRGELGLKVRKRRQWIGARYTISIEMAVTDVIPNQRLRINNDERLDPRLVFSDEPFQFDPAFWGIYNTIKPEASLMESILQLERNREQFNE